MDIFLGIDGSGASNDAEYAEDFKESFVQAYARSGMFVPWSYFRGPTMSGFTTQSIANGGLKWIKGQIAAAQKERTKFRLFLSGYSRGGAAVTWVAHQLGRDNIGVHAMFLFDAVDLSQLGNVDVVSSNVERCYHARRSPAAASREVFGNCATRHAVPQNYQERFFLCTHGAMGGTPWKKVGKSGHVEELTAAQKSAIMAPAILSGNAAAIAAAKREADRQDFTTIDLKEEQDGTKAVKAWMDGNLGIARGTAGS
jgi:hypothetical protein